MLNSLLNMKKATLTVTENGDGTHSLVLMGENKSPLVITFQASEVYEVESQVSSYAEVAAAALQSSSNLSAAKAGITTKAPSKNVAPETPETCESTTDADDLLAAFTKA